MPADVGERLPRLSQWPVAAYTSDFRVAGVSVQITGARESDVTLVRSLEPFRTDMCISDIHIQVEWTRHFPPVSGRRLFDSGSVWKLYEDEAGFQFDLTAPILGHEPYKRLLVDESFTRATLWMNESYFSDGPRAPVPLDYPLDELLIAHRLTQEEAIELHGCGIVRADGTGNLFVGHSGAGKSTTTRLWTHCEDVEILSDDRIIVRLELDPDEKTSFPCRRKVQPSRFMRMYGTPWHGEAMYASPGSAPIARIFVLEHGFGNVLTRLSPSAAVAELFARSFVPFHRHEYVESALAFLQQVSEAVPVYRYEFEPDQRAVDTILNLHD